MVKYAIKGLRIRNMVITEDDIRFIVEKALNKILPNLKEGILHSYDADAVRGILTI